MLIRGRFKIHFTSQLCEPSVICPPFVAQYRCDDSFGINTFLIWVRRPYHPANERRNRAAQTWTLQPLELFLVTFGRQEIPFFSREMSPSKVRHFEVRIWRPLRYGPHFSWVYEVMNKLRMSRSCLSLMAANTNNRNASSADGMLIEFYPFLSKALQQHRPRYIPASTWIVRI